MPPPTLVPYSRKIQGIDIESYKDHNDADNDLNSLVKKIHLSKNDPGYFRLQNFLDWQEKSFQSAQKLNSHRTKIKDLIDDFFKKDTSIKNFDTNKDKEDFKDAWRDLVPNTDEHLSTQSMYVILNALRSKAKLSLNPQSVNMDVVKDFAVAASFFRLPTIETGHNASINGKSYTFAHPRGPNDSIHISGTGNPLHTGFDTTRRFFGFNAGDAYHSMNQSDGTGTLLSILQEAVKFTTHWIASPYSFENVVQNKIFSDLKIREFFYRRESLKKNLSVLINGPNVVPSTQKYNTSQYGQFSSPAARSIRSVTNASGTKRKRASSPSLERDDPVHTNNSLAITTMSREFPFEI